MKNNFSLKTRQLFDMGGYMVSWESGRNDADALHHIFKRVSDSPYNAAPLNNKREHLPEGRMMLGLPSIHSEVVQQMYLKKTFDYLAKIGYKPTKDDYEFLKKYYK